MRRFDHDGRTLLVDTIGRIDGPHFVLVHGIGVASRYYRRLAATLAGSGAVHLLELPGHGAAPEPAEAMSIEDYASLIGAYLDSEDIVDPVLVGHSMGAQIVTELGLQQPDRVQRVVLIGAVVDPRERNIVSLASKLFLDSFVETPQVDWIETTDYLRCGPRWFLKTVPAMMSYSLIDSLPRLRAETLVIRGIRDPIARHDWSVRMAGVTPHARLVEIDGAHVVMHTAAQAVADEIVAFTLGGVAEQSRVNDRIITDEIVANGRDDERAALR